MTTASLVASLASVSVRSRFALGRRDIMRGVAAGAVFGIVLTVGFAALSTWQCGGVCLAEVAGNAVLSLTAGILGLGPVAAFGGRR